MSWQSSVWQSKSEDNPMGKTRYDTCHSPKGSPCFDHKAQRRRLLAAGVLRLLVTVAVCALLGITILLFDRLKRGITTSERRGFNTVIIGLSLVLSLNLFYSLEGCAQTIRWRLVASEYHSLKQFDLVFNFDRKWNAFRLLWSARTPGSHTPNKTQLLALLYLLVSLGLLADTAVLGLTYSMEVSARYKLSKPGTVSVAKLDSISPLQNSRTAHFQQAQNYGLISQGFIPVVSSLGVNQTRNAGLLSLQHNEAADLFWYQFMDFSAENLNYFAPSTRYVTSKATCREVAVVSGGHGGYNLTTGEPIEESSVRIRDGDEAVQDIYIGDFQAPGATTWLGSINPGSGTCGPRCAHVWALQSAYASPGREEPRFWKCTNTVSDILNTNRDVNASAFEMPQSMAQIMAGAIGFSGVERQDDPFQRVLYAYGNAFAPSNDEAIMNVFDMEATIMWFTTGAFAAMDSFGPRVKVTNQRQPMPAQVLSVNWGYTIAVLAIPPLAQALVLVATIIYGDKTVVRDGGAISTARLLEPLAQRLGHEGGEAAATTDILEKSFGQYRIKYRPVCNLGRDIEIPLEARM